jgi:hypothetical protein
MLVQGLSLGPGAGLGQEIKAQSRFTDAIAEFGTDESILEDR